MHVGIVRTRWAAIGAAVAVSLGAGGGIMLTHATSPVGAVAYVPITPCRVVDTRPAPDNVGTRATPIGSGETFTVSAHGNNGACVGIPATATGLSLNVTAVGATASTFLTVWPTGATKPNASSLNPTPGQPPTPNAVTTGLSAGGQFDVFNLVGSVNVIVDVVGYYSDHQHTGADIVDSSLTAADVADNSLTNADTSNEPGISSSYSTTLVALPLNVATSVSSVEIRPPSNGFIEIEVTGNWLNNAGVVADFAECQLQKGAAIAIDALQPSFRLHDRPVSGAGPTSFSAHRIVPVSVADNPPLNIFGQSMRLVCTEWGGDVAIDDIYLTATFYATSYAPGVLVFSP